MRKLFKGGNYSREETIWWNTVPDCTEIGLSILVIGLVTTSSKGLISAPKTAQLKHKAANIQFAPSQPYRSSKKLASGAKTKVPTPLPQTAMPRNEIESDNF